MPTSREQAQRYAEASRRKKRRSTGPRVVLQKSPSEEPALEADERPLDSIETVSRSSRSTAFQPRVQRAKPPTRRAFSEYRAEYGYVIRDLRRVAAVAGLLLILLIALHFILR